MNAPSKAASSADNHGERIVEGTGGAPGIAIGPVYRHSGGGPEVAQKRVGRDELEAEVDRLQTAFRNAVAEIEHVRSVAARLLGEARQGILEAQQMMLQDDTLVEAITNRIRDERFSAGWALKTVLNTHRNRLEESEDAYLRRRTEDLQEVEDRVLRALLAETRDVSVPPGAIVVADTLTAADLVRFSEEGMHGCVTKAGGATSHVSILARALRIPALVGVGPSLEGTDQGDRVIVDGLHGRLIIDPTSDTLAEYRRRRTRESERRTGEAEPTVEPVRTTDGHRITLQANINLPRELDTLHEHGAEGIGLLRTETFFASRLGGLPSEDRQVSTYRKAGAAVTPYAATVRLLDLGGDKPLSRFDDEPNPALGLRGVRFLLERREDLLRRQLRALLRANAHTSLRVLLPMVSRVEEVNKITELLREEEQQLAEENAEHDPNLPLGLVVEVPATALRATQFVEVVDFLSIGTNDLTQYVLAVDRGNNRVASDYDALHPAVLELIQRTTAAGREAAVPVSLCGEMAHDLEAVPILVGLGLYNLSVIPPYLSPLRQMIRCFAYTEAQSLADAVLRAPDAKTVRHQSRQWLDERVDLDRLDFVHDDDPYSSL